MEKKNVGGRGKGGKVEQTIEQNADECNLIWWSSRPA